MHPNEPQLFWQAAMTARALASRTDTEGAVLASDAVDDVADFAAHASPPIAKRAQELLGWIAREAPDPWLRVMADGALQDALHCRASLPNL